MSLFTRSPHWRKLLAVAPALLAGCVGHMSPAIATFHGINQPMILGSVDRIGAGAPLAVRTVGEFEGKSDAHFSNTSQRSGNLTITTTENWANSLEIYENAVTALKLGGPNADIRVTTLRTWALGYLCCMHNTVYIQGDVVNVGAGK
jgi:hypothetical protein